jgi:hypothetical protein
MKAMLIVCLWRVSRHNRFDKYSQWNKTETKRREKDEMISDEKHLTACIANDVVATVLI